MTDRARLRKVAEAAFIPSANPATMLELMDELDRMQAIVRNPNWRQPMANEESQRTVCVMCQGTGTRVVPLSVAEDAGFDMIEVDCPGCEGKGWLE